MASGAKNDYKWSDMQNVIYSILQYVLQYGSAILQYAFCRIVSPLFVEHHNY